MVPLLKDPLISDWIRAGRAQLDIYLWNSGMHAVETFAHAKAAKLKPVVSTKYHSEFDKDHGVQIFFNMNRGAAVAGAVAMADSNDVFFSIAAEKVGWLSEIPGIALPIVAQNNKMDMNTYWAREAGLIGSETELVSPGETIRQQLEDSRSRFRTLYERSAAISDRVAKEIGDQSFELFNATKVIPQRVLAA